MENNFPPKQCILVGGGSSISEGISLGLWNVIKNKFVIGCNQSYNHLISTIQCYCDRDYFEAHMKDLYNLPLVIGNSFGTLTKETENLFVFKSSNKYCGKDGFKKGLYRSTLVGIWALTVAICCEASELFLLGYDWNKNTDKKNKEGKVITHYYESDKRLKHRGIGITKFFDDHNPKQYFGVYLNEPVKIYTVGKTNIKCFENIDYPVFFQKIKNSPDCNQSELRNWIRKKIKEDRKK